MQIRFLHMLRSGILMKLVQCIQNIRQGSVFSIVYVQLYVLLYIPIAPPKNIEIQQKFDNFWTPEGQGP